MYANAKQLQDNECLYKTQIHHQSCNVTEDEDSPTQDEFLILSLNLKEEGPTSYYKTIPKKTHSLINACNAPPYYSYFYLKRDKGENLKRF